MMRYTAALIILTLTAIAHILIHYRQAEAARVKSEQSGILKSIPADIAEYRQDGEDFKVSDSVQQALRSSEILMRRYRASNGWPIDLTIVYAGTTRRSLHFPEVCLVGHGYEIREQIKRPVGLLFEAKGLVLVKSREQDAVLYWFKTGDVLTGNFFANSWEWAKNQLTFGAPTSAMIKLETPIAGRDEEMIFGLLEDFALKLAPVIAEVIP